MSQIKAPLCIIGAGYVGLVSAACLAHLGNTVIVVDKTLEKISKLKQGLVEIYEPGLSEIVKETTAGERLLFSDNLIRTLRESSPALVFLAVGTPDRPDGTCNTDFLFEAFDEIQKNIVTDTVVIIKSTVPVGTANQLSDRLAQRPKNLPKISIVNNPEFLKEGRAVEDFLRPERIVLGGSDPDALNRVNELYLPLVRNGHSIILTDSVTAELSKLSANLALASRVSLINQISRLSDSYGAQIRDVEKILKTDSRIGGKYLYAGLGFGGSCFPKDIRNFVSLCKNQGVDSQFAQSILDLNESQKEIFIPEILKAFPNSAQTTLSLWGLAFKPDTDDIREAPSLRLVSRLATLGYKLKLYDPKASANFSTWLVNQKDLPKNKIEFCPTAVSCLKDSNGLIIATEWPEFSQSPQVLLKNYFKGTHIFDGRNVYRPKQITELGFVYRGIGQS